MTAIENRIRMRHNGDKLIGRYCNTPKPYFKDIRGYEGETLDISDLHPESLEIEYPSGGLDSGSFYEFSWKVNNETGDFIVVGVPELVTNEVFLQRLLGINLKKTGGDLAQAVQDQALASDEITGAQHTYLYELLQNANDYPYNGEDVKVLFLLTKHYLFFLHTGAEFDLLNIVGICSRHQGQKADKVGTIGYKGIGFKTVFVKNDYVYLKTGEWSLRFDEKQSSAAKGGGKTPWTIMPWPTSFSDLDEEVQTVLKSIPDEYRVKFALRHNEDAMEHIQQLDKVFGNDEILLFIPHVTDVQVNIDGKGVTHHVVKDKEKWATKTYANPVSDKLKEWVKQDRKNGGKTPKKFENIEAVQISFAIPRVDNVICPMEADKTRVFNYLPTELRLGLPFFINADFIPDASRSGLHPDLKWNDTVMGECGKRFVDWFASLLQNENEYDISSVFSMCPVIKSTDHYTNLFMNYMNMAFGKVECIPVLADGNYGLKCIKEIIYDCTGLTSGDNPVLSDEEFYSLSGLDGYLPHPDCRNHSNLIEILRSHSASAIKFDGTSLANMARTPEFKEWLKLRENNTKFLRFLLESEFIVNFYKEEIILKQDGTLGRVNQTFLDVDAYIEDLLFLSDQLPRIDVEERDSLSTVKGWNDFKERFDHFNPGLFIDKVLPLASSSLSEKFSVIENSASFIHFMALAGNDKRFPDSYPVFADSGVKVGRRNLYVRDYFGDEFSKLPWIKHEWVSFVNAKYFEKDSAKVMQLFFRSGVKNVTPETAYNSFLGDDSRITHIAETVNSDIATNIQFYQFYAGLNVAIKFTEEARKVLKVFTTDGKSVESSPIKDTIFYRSPEWENIRKEKWLPSTIGRAVSEEYLNGNDGENVKSFFSSRSIVQQFSLSGFFNQSIESHRKEIFSLICDKESSKCFLDFLFRNNQIFFKGEVPPSAYKDIPVFLQDSGDSTTANKENCIFYHTEDLDELQSQIWFQEGSVVVLDSFYNDIFDGKERLDFFKSIGLLKFDLKKYVLLRIFQNNDGLKKSLEDRVSNMAFHHYFSDKQRLFTDDEYAPLHNFPVIIASPTDSEGELVDSSEDHYLPSELLTRFITQDLVPRDILDSIHPDYIRGAEDLAYFEKIGNVEIKDENFISYITGEHNLKPVSEYLSTDKERNIRFWRWACDAKVSYEDKKSLQKLPVIIKGTVAKYATTENTYIPDEYLDTAGEEDLVRRIVAGAQFISPEYIEENDERNWRSFFHALGVIIGGKEIVFKKVLPNLGDEQYWTLSIIPLLSGYYQDIQEKISSDPKLRSELANLHLKCNDGIYRIPEQLVIAGKFFDLESEPIPDVCPNHFISEEYLSQDNPKTLRNVKDLLRLIADNFNAACDTKTKVRDEKIRYYYDNQEDYSKDRLSHDKIVRDIADEYAADNVGVRELINSPDLPCLMLFNMEGELMDADTLTLGSSFNPDCDFMAGGVSSIKYVDESYSSLSRNIKPFFLKALDVRDDFEDTDLEYLRFPKFACYFWNEYAPSHQSKLEPILTEDNLKTRICIPTTSGVKRPCDLYDYRNSSLKSMIDRIHPEETDVIPSIRLPKWMNDTRIGFRPVLYIEDCLKYLSLETTDYRRDAMLWVIRCDDTTLYSHREQINEYLEHATWLNGKKEWVPLKNLVALEKDNKTLDAFFKSNAHVCNPSYMPEYKMDYNRLCEIFNITVITDRDFEKNPDGENHIDKEAIVEIKKRLAYLSFASGKDDWTDIYREFTKKLTLADIRRCERILYRYNDDIHTELKVYSDSDNSLWYTKPWDSAPLENIISWLTRILNLKDSLRLDEGLIRNVFWDDISTVLKNYEGGAIPQELHDIISELGKIDIAIRKDEAEKRFSELATGGDINNVPAVRESSMSNLEDEADNIEQNDSASISTASEGEVEKLPEKQVNHSNNTPPSKPSSEGRTRTSDVSGRTASSHQTAAASQRQPMQNSPVAEETKERESVEERLLESWNSKKNSEVRRPAGRTTSNDNPYVPNEAEISTASEGEFFSDEVAQGRSMNPSSKTSQKVNRSYTDAQNSVDKAQDKVDLFKLFDEETVENKYSFKWFNLLMELMYSERKKESRREIRIEFAESKLLHDNIVVLLKPSKAIPSWIESADHLSITSLKNKQTINATVSSRTDDAVWLSVAEGSELSAIIGDGKVRLNADGTSFTFIDALMTRFIQLGYPLDFNMKDNLPDCIQYIYGPPGTGKTTELVKQIKQSLSSGDASSSFIVLAPTNRAADEVAERLLSDADCIDFTWRYGTTESVLVLSSGHLISRDSSFPGLPGPRVLITTIHRFSYDYLDSRTPICDYSWERVFIDEASMIDISNITYVLHKVEYGTPIVIAGDPMQIQPIEENDIQPENIYQMVGIESFAEASQRADVIALSKQYRSVPEIGDLVSKFAYDGMLQHNRDGNVEQPLRLEGYSNLQKVNFIGFRMEMLDQFYGCDTVALSAFHLYSVILAYNFAEYIVRSVTELGYSNYSVGIVCPYKQQASAIADMLERRPIETENCKVKCGTVHKFQGGECDTMIVVMNPPVDVTSGAHINNRNIVNVAISRAKDTLFIMVPDHKIDNFWTRELLGKLSENHSVTFSADIERMMFNSENFIERNTAVSCHMPTNIYYEPTKLYEVRIDENAVDIQINEGLKED